MGGAFKKHDGSRRGCARGYLIQGSGRGGKGTIILETREAIHQSTSSQPSLTEARFEEMDRATPKRLKEDVCQHGKGRKVKPDLTGFQAHLTRVLLGSITVFLFYLYSPSPRFRGRVK